MSTQSLRDRIKQRMKEQSNSQGAWCIQLPEGKEAFKTKPKMLLDLLPYVVSVSNNPEAKKGELLDRRKYGVHRNVGIDNKSRVCPQITLGLPCPICEARTKLMKGSEEDRAMAPEKVKVRELYNVLDLNDEEKGVQVWDISYHLFTKQLEEEVNNDDTGDYAGYAELKDGYTLKLRFKDKTMPDKKTGKNSEPFLEVSRIDFEKRDIYPKTILDEVNDLDKCLKVLSYSDLEKEFYGTGTVKEESEDVNEVEEVEEEPAPKKKTSFRDKLKSKPIEEEEVEVEEVEEEPAPKKVARKSKEKEVAADECPNGYKFGVDTDSKDECGDCPNWDACGDLYEANKKKVKKK